MAHAAGLRTNTDFQIQYFVEGSAQTDDGKWALLWMQVRVQQQKIDSIPAYHIKREAQLEQIEFRIVNAKTPWKRKLAEAELIETKIGHAGWEVVEQAWIDEIDFMKRRMALLDEDCLYRDLPLLQRIEAAQRLEWCEELKVQAENYIISQGFIPHDHLHAMRMHPDFELKILPHIGALCDLKMKCQGHPALMLANLPQMKLLTAPPKEGKPQAVISFNAMKGQLGNSH